MNYEPLYYIFGYVLLSLFFGRIAYQNASNWHESGPRGWILGMFWPIYLAYTVCRVTTQAVFRFADWFAEKV